MGYLLADFSVILCVLACITPALCKEIIINENGSRLKVRENQVPADIAKGSANAGCLKLKLRDIPTIPNLKMAPANFIEIESTELHTCMVPETFEAFHLVKRVYRVMGEVHSVSFPDKGIDVSKRRVEIQRTDSAGNKLMGIGIEMVVPIITETTYFKVNNFNEIFYFGGKVKALKRP